MAEPGPDVPKYPHMEGVETLRHIPNTKPSSADEKTNSVAIRIPGEAKEDTVAEVSHKELEALIESTATSLWEKAGLGASGSGTIVSIIMPNGMDFILSFLAVPWTRSVSAPLNQNYTEKEFHFYMEDNQSKMMLVSDAFPVPAAEAAAKTLGIPVYSISWKKDTPTIVQVTHKAGPEKLGGDDDKKEDGEESNKKVKPTFEPEPSDVALFLHTSGTTAKPKGVPLRHENLIASMNNISRTYELEPSDAVLLIMPLFHVHGLMSALMSTLATGGTVILPPQTKFSATQFWQNASVGKATWVTCVPTIYQVLLLRYETDYPKNEEDIPKFRFVRSCSSALAPSILKEIEEKFHAPCVEAYAMTEASHQMCSNPIKDGPRKAGTVGKGTGVAVAILDGENKVIEEPDKEGEVCIRGKNVTAGYIGVKDEVNKEAFAGGWFHTGDQGKLDSDGYLTLTGRIKELINRGGEKISPLEVDAAMIAHDDIAEAVSFSMPDEKYGEVVAAAIVLKDDKKNGDGTLDEKGLQEYLKDKLSSFKIPVKVYFDDKLPKTATGKIQRRIVASHFLEKK